MLIDFQMLTSYKRYKLSKIIELSKLFLYLHR